MDERAVSWQQRLRERAVDHEVGGVFVSPSRTFRMSRDNVAIMRDEILQVLAMECGLETIPALATSLSDLATDSLDVICAVNALEDRFDIKIPFDGNSTNVETVGDIVTMVERLIAGEGQR